MSVIPTLHPSSSELLTDKQDIIAYIVRWSLTNPGHTSSFVEDELVSFRKLEAEYGSDKEALAKRFTSKLNGVINNYYPDQKMSVEVTATDIDDIKYKLSISVTDSDGSYILDRGIVEVTNNSLILKF